MLLSIVVPVYNVEKYLARCLDSLLDQDLDGTAHEIIIVNDGSPDGSLAIAETYAQKHPQLKIVTQPNQGLSEARNTGLRHSSGKYLYFIDSDDYIERKVLKNLLAIAERHQLDFFGFGSTITPLSDYSNPVDFTELLNKIDAIKVYDGVSYIATHNFLANAWWYIVRKEMLDKTGLLYEKGRMLEDGIHTTELLLNCQRVASEKLDIYRYFVNPNSITTRKDEKHIAKLNDDFKFVIRKFFDLIALAKQKNANADAIARLKNRQEAYLFFLYVRLIKTGITYGNLRKLMAEMKALGLHPIRNFIGIDYHSKQERLLTVIFNNPLLLFGFMKANAILKIIK